MTLIQALTSLFIIPSCSCSCNVLVVYSGDGLEPGANTHSSIARASRASAASVLVGGVCSRVGVSSEVGASVPACPAVPHSGLSRLYRGTSHLTQISPSGAPTSRRPSREASRPTLRLSCRSELGGGAEGCVLGAWWLPRRPLADALADAVTGKRGMVHRRPQDGEASNQDGGRPKHRDRKIERMDRRPPSAALFFNTLQTCFSGSK